MEGFATECVLTLIIHTQRRRCVFGLGQEALAKVLPRAQYFKVEFPNGMRCLGFFGTTGRPSWGALAQVHIQAAHPPSFLHSFLCGDFLAFWLSVDF